MIVADIPFAVFDREEFWAILPYSCSISAAGMEPSFDSLYQSTVDQMEQILSKVRWFSATTDGWSSRSLHGHTTVSLHWVDEDWSLRRAVLGIPLIEGPSTASNIAKYTKAALLKFSIPEQKVHHFCIDQGANYVRAVKDMPHVDLTHCLCHILNHVMQDVAEQKLDDIMNWAHPLVKHYKQSNTARRELAEVQVARNSTVRNVKSAGATRWSSNLIVLRRLAEIYGDMEQLVQRNGNVSELWDAIGKPSPDQLNDIDDVFGAVKAVLDLFQSDLSALSGTIVMALTRLHSLNKIALRDSKSKFHQDLRLAVRTALSDRICWAAIPSIWWKAMYLDPRFKDMTLVDDLIPTEGVLRWSGVKRKTKLRIKQELIHQLNGSVGVPLFRNPVVVPVSVDRTDHIEADSDLSDDDEGPYQPPQPKRQCSHVSYGSIIHRLGLSATRAAEPVVVEEQISGISLELRLYDSLETPAVDICPLSWWKIHATDLPLLSALAKKYLAVQASAAASERVWSLAGNAHTAKRFNLSPDKLDKLVTIKCHLH